MSSLTSMMPGMGGGTAVATAPATADSGVQAITPGGYANADWINSLQKLGYTPNGQNSWGNIGTMQPTSLLTSLGQPAPLKIGG